MFFKSLFHKPDHRYLDKFKADAFSDGQIGSKLWLCEELEKVAAQDGVSDSVIWILGGWYGVLSFLLFTRDRLRPAQVRSFDIDQKAVATADRVNDHWRLQNQRFMAIQEDCNLLDYQSTAFGPLPDIVINTSCEHFEDLSWWRRIPTGKLVVLQSTDMENPEHVMKVGSTRRMREIYAPFEALLFEGSKTFTYSSFSFTRYMLIGIKG